MIALPAFIGRALPDTVLLGYAAAQTARRFADNVGLGVSYRMPIQPGDTMQNVRAPHIAATSRVSMFGTTHVASRRVATCPDRCELDCRADHQFLAMLDAYRSKGGLAHPHEVTARLERRGHPDRTLLRTWIDKREVICFEWQSQAWLPLFQFSRSDMMPHRQLRPVFAELTSVYDPWEMGNWFVRPNPWLVHRMPLDVLLSDLSAVLHAARADRFIANG